MVLNPTTRIIWRAETLVSFLLYLDRSCLGGLCDRSHTQPLKEYQDATLPPQR